MELRDGFMPLLCWKCELCDICCKFVELSSLPLPLQTFPTEIGIGGCEGNSLQTVIYGCLCDYLAIKALFCVEKKAENKHVPSHNLPAQGIYSVYPDGTLCGLSIQGMVIQFESRKVQATNSRQGNSHFLWSGG